MYWTMSSENNAGSTNISKYAVGSKNQFIKVMYWTMSLENTAGSTNILKYTIGYKNQCIKVVCC